MNENENKNKNKARAKAETEAAIDSELELEALDHLVNFFTSSELGAPEYLKLALRTSHALLHINKSLASIHGRVLSQPEKLSVEAHRQVAIWASSLQDCIEQFDTEILSQLEREEVRPCEDYCGDCSYYDGVDCTWHKSDGGCRPCEEGYRE